MLPLGADDPRVIGEFRLHTRLGAGGMGRVYLASSPGGRAVAVKVIHPHLARDPMFVDRFRREVFAAQRVNGGFAAPVLAAGPDDDPPWLATAYAGPSLQEAVTETGPLPEEATVKLAAGLAEALRDIHDGGMVHRDLKPDNVLLAEDGPRVIDFGIAQALASTGLTSLTSTGSVLGTPSYMSPEQAQGQRTGPASDVFSLGGVLYFAATGTRPFSAGNPAGLLYRIVRAEPDLEPVPPRLRDLTAACLAKDPARRPAPAQLVASLADAIPPGDSPAVFWPAPVARLIAGHQARFAAGLAAGEQEPAGTPTVTVVAANSVSTGPPGDPISPPPAPTVPPGAGGAGADETQPVPGMGRRRALAALAGMATAGLVVAGWELTRPGPRSTGSLTAAQRPAVTRNPAAQRRVSSLRPGTEVWSFEANGTVAAASVAGGVIYVGTLQKAVYALDALTGKQLWRHLMGNGETQYLWAASDVVIAANGYNGVEGTGFLGGVYALDPGTGKLLWSADAPYVFGLDVVGDVVYAATAIKDVFTGGVTALDTRTGELLWTFNFPATIDIDVGVTAAGGVVYCTTSLGEIFALSADTGNQLWRNGDPAIAFGSAPVITDGVIYASSNHNKRNNASPVVYAVEARTGRGLWQHPLGPALDTSVQAVADGLVFVVAVRENNSSAEASGLFALNAASGQQLWQVPLAGSTVSATSGPGNMVYSTNGVGTLDAWQATTGNHLWSYRASGAIASGMVLNGGIAYFGSTSRRFYAVAARA
jgi:outer membrane protein assembly factor BamB